jgi:L-lactate dehydrogenase complex protein LldG
MSDQKELVLKRVRAALAGSHPPRPAEGPDFLRASTASREEIVALFIEHAADYRADVRRVEADSAALAITARLREREIRRLAIPVDFPEEWMPEGVELLSDANGPLSHAELDAADGVLTGCALAIAQTGSLVLDGGAGQGRRALTLLPDYHLCVVRADQVVGLMPEAVSQLTAAARDRRQPITLISGPSATSDIELNRVEGVHGPRVLDILVVG